MQKLIDSEWVDCTEPELNEGDVYRVPVGGDISKGTNGWHQRTFVTEKQEESILLTVSLSEVSCLIGSAVDYEITFSESISVPYIVPISVSDRNGNHVTNIGCSVKDGKATGSFKLDSAGDFTVTNEAINFHNSLITKKLKLTSQPWLRVYQ